MIIKINSSETRITSNTSIDKKKSSSSTHTTKSFSDSLSQVEIMPVNNSNLKERKSGKFKPKSSTAFSWGNQALEELEKIQMNLLTGGIPISRLKHLNDFVSNIPFAINPDLNNLLKDIKLRISIELAKYET